MKNNNDSNNNGTTVMSDINKVGLASFPLPDPTIQFEKKWSESILDRFNRHTSSSLAILTEEEGWTYSELDDASTRLADHISKFRSGNDERVAIYASRNAALPISMLAAIKAGYAFVILDPDHPQIREQKMLEPY